MSIVMSTYGWLAEPVAWQMVIFWAVSVGLIGRGEVLFATSRFAAIWGHGASARGRESPVTLSVALPVRFPVRSKYLVRMQGRHMQVVGVIYYATVALFQEAFRAVARQQFALAIVASTLAIAALFQPLRRRIQTFFDQRFYRRKYDAAQVLDRFGLTVRDTVELDQLNEQPVEVVDETMRPAHVSLWLAPVKAGVTSRTLDGHLASPRRPVPGGQSGSA